MGSKTRMRAATLGLLALSLLVVGFGYVTASSVGEFDEQLGPDGPTDPSAEVAPPHDGITVVATDSNTWRGRGVEGPRSRSQLVAFDTDGSILHHDDSHTRYWDVDQVPGTEATVEYLYSDHVEGSECDATNASRHAADPEVWERYERDRADADACTRNGIERTNLATGETTAVWSRITPGKDASRYHDADRINETHFVVADIYLDRVFVVDVSADEIVWTWNASDALPTSTGGAYPTDWTHVNDVEVLEDGRFMASLRNQDRVVFIDPAEGLQEEWTLGAEDDYEVMYEQHNPDYVPEDRGGPAVIVSDSENDRVQEFQRVDGEWERTWEWSDYRMQWPRDADRLPNGHTLITDSNGDRVFEVDESGSIVWSVDVAFPYEAERLGTGDESQGGYSAVHPEVNAESSGGGFLSDLKSDAGGKYMNAALYVTPVWMGPLEVVAVVLGVLALLTFVLAEVAWQVRTAF